MTVEIDGKKYTLTNVDGKVQMSEMSSIGSRLKSKFGDIKDRLTTKIDGVKSKLQVVKSSLGTLGSKIDELKAKQAELKAKKAEVDTKSVEVSDVQTPVDSKRVSRPELDKYKVRTQSTTMSAPEFVSANMKGLFAGEKAYNAAWMEFLHPDGSQGVHSAWKMHLFSDSNADWQKMSEVVIPYLKDQGVIFKTVNNVFEDGFEWLNADALQKGKAFTIYPQSNAQMAKIAQDLDYIIRNNGLEIDGSKIAGDRAMGDSGRLFYRYELNDPSRLNDVFDMDSNAGKADYHSAYESNSARHASGRPADELYLANGMTPADDPFRNFDPSDPNSQISTNGRQYELRDSADVELRDNNGIQTRGSNSNNTRTPVADYSSKPVGSKLPNNQGVTIKGNETLKLADTYNLDLSNADWQARLNSMSDGDVITVGRNGDIKIDDPSNLVSAQHLQIQKVGDSYVVTDLSRNGTKIGTSVSSNIKSNFGEQFVRTLYDMPVGTSSTLSMSDGFTYTFKNINGQVDISAKASTSVIEALRKNAPKVKGYSVSQAMDITNGNNGWEILTTGVHGPRLDASLENAKITLSNGVEVKLCTDSNIVTRDYLLKHPFAIGSSDVKYLSPDSIKNVQAALEQMVATGQTPPERLFITDMFSDFQVKDGTWYSPAGEFCGANPNCIFISNKYPLTTDYLRDVIYHESAHMSDYSLASNMSINNLSDRFSNLFPEKSTYVDIPFPDGSHLNVSNSDIERYISAYALENNHEFIAEITQLMTNGTIVKDSATGNFKMNVDSFGYYKNAKGVSTYFNANDPASVSILNDIMKLYELLTDYKITTPTTV